MNSPLGLPADMIETIIKKFCTRNGIPLPKDDVSVYDRLEALLTVLTDGNASTRLQLVQSRIDAKQFQDLKAEMYQQSINALTMISEIVMLMAQMETSPKERIGQLNLLQEVIEFHKSVIAKNYIPF